MTTLSSGDSTTRCSLCDASAMLYNVCSTLFVQCIDTLLQAESRRRSGVAQYKQPHVLLQKGLELIEEIFPGYKQELAQAGALDLDLLSDIIVVSFQL